MLQRLRTARNRELVNLLLVAMLLASGFCSVLIARSGAVSADSLGYALVVLALVAIAHGVLRYALPDADPYLLPLCALLCAVGITEIYRIDPSLARDQTVWLAVGVAAFSALLLCLHDYRTLERYRYVIGATALGLLALTILLSYATGTVINGARVWIRVGGFQIQPAEFAKLGLVIFLAAYLRERREVLALRSRLGLPAARHLGPLLVTWGGALVLLVLMNDFGTSLLFYGVFLAMVYVATGRPAYVAVGAIAFALGAIFAEHVAPQVGERVSIWLDPWKDPQNHGYQIVQAIYSVADGGVFGAGLGRGYLLTAAGRPVIPAVHTDFIYAAIADELGLAGAAALLLCYLLVAYRGLRVATLAGDGFSKLAAAGLTVTVALQAFLIVGGVVRAIPLTGLTLPFVSYGGSSMVSNWLLLALLLAISDRANRLATRGAAP